MKLEVKYEVLFPYQEDFILEKLERAKVSGAVVLDDTPRSEWRVSSLVSSPLAGVQHSLVRMFSQDTKRANLFPIVVVRSADWRRHENLLRREGSNLYISWSSLRCQNCGALPPQAWTFHSNLLLCVRQEALTQELSCSEEKVVRITEGQEEDGDCESGKFLSSSGEIMERLCVTSQCTKFGGKCSRHFDLAPGEEEARKDFDSLILDCRTVLD